MQDITNQLDRVCGGGAQWDAYLKGQRTRIAPKYKEVVCAAAGIKGGPQMATEVYGPDRATESDKVRAAQTLRGICIGGDHLPAGAPASPF